MEAHLRFSFGRFNTEEDVEYVLDALPEVVQALRAAPTDFMYKGPMVQTECL